MKNWLHSRQSSSHGKIDFYWSSNIQVLSLLSKLLVKIKRHNSFGMHNDTQKLGF